jgi:hypothetical protein
MKVSIEEKKELIHNVTVQYSIVKLKNVRYSDAKGAIKFNYDFRVDPLFGWGLKENIKNDDVFTLAKIISPSLLIELVAEIEEYYFRNFSGHVKYSELLQLKGTIFTLSDSLLEIFEEDIKKNRSLREADVIELMESEESNLNLVECVYNMGGV